MTEIVVRTARPDDAKPCAELIYMTMGGMADHLLGGDEAEWAKTILMRLFQRPKNRYSYEYTNLAIIADEIAGLLLSYPARILKLLDLPMIGSILAVGKLSDSLQFFYRSLPLMNVKEVEMDEYFINNVAVFPKFRGKGVGTYLMKLAEKKARDNGLNKCSLTVEIEHESVVALYKHLGYRIMDTIEVEVLKQRIGFGGLYRMVKILDD